MNLWFEVISIAESIEIPMMLMVRKFVSSRVYSIQSPVINFGGVSVLFTFLLLGS